MKILIISDSHLDNNWKKIKHNYDVVIHAGDHMMSKEWMLTNTDYYVDGNNDWGNNFIQQFKIDKYNFLLVHGDEFNLKKSENISQELQIFAKQLNVDIVIYGHTHIPSIKTIDNIVFINPGSISKPRLLNNLKTYCELIIDEHSHLTMKIKNFEF